jgi:predicted enzyme related to lactoylglutathione lyase
MFKKLRTVIYNTGDLQQAKAWYKAITGLNPYFDEPFYVGFDINGCELGLDPAPLDGAKGSQAVAYWAVDGIQACLDRLTEQGATVKQQVTAVGGAIQVAVVEDPFGNSIGLIEGA